MSERRNMIESTLVLGAVLFALLSAIAFLVDVYGRMISGHWAGALPTYIVLVVFGAFSLAWGYWAADMGRKTAALEGEAAELERQIARLEKAIDR